MGLLSVAAFGTAVWKTASISLLDFSNHGGCLFLVSIYICTDWSQAMMIWAPYTKSNGQWIANKILQGFFGAPIESLCEVSVTDIVSRIGIILRENSDRRLCSILRMSVVHTLVSTHSCLLAVTSSLLFWPALSTMGKIGNGSW